MRAGNHRFLMLIAEYDNRKGWSDGGTQSCAHWLNYRCGIDLGAAREKVRVAHALESLPKISAAMAEGRLSYSKVRALTRVACEGTEDYLLSIALNGTADHVEKTVRGFRRAKEVEELSREAQQQANKRVSYYFDNDGSLVVKARLPAETGALLIKALDGALEDLRGAEMSADVSAEMPTVKSPRHVQRADALGLLAESFIAHGAATLNGGDRHQIVVHVDAETLHTSTAGRCEIEDGPSLAAETARRLACDASVISILWPVASSRLPIAATSFTSTSALAPAAGVASGWTMDSRSRCCWLRRDEQENAGRAGSRQTFQVECLRLRGH